MSPCVAGIYYCTLSPIHFLFFPPEAPLRQNSAGFGAWLEERLQTSITKESGPLDIFPELSCNFSLTLITKHESTKKSSRHSAHILDPVVTTQFPLIIRFHHSIL